MPRFLPALKQRLVSDLRDPTLKAALVDRRAVVSLGLAERLRTFRHANDSGRCKNLRQSHINRVTAPFMTSALERYGRLGAMSGIEARAPLAAKPVVEFCLSLPWQKKFCDGWSKIQLRKVAARHLPSGLAWQRGRRRLNWKFWYARDQRRPGALQPPWPDALAKQIDSEKIQRLLGGPAGHSVGARESTVRIAALCYWLTRVK